MSVFAKQTHQSRASRLGTAIVNAACETCDGKAIATVIAALRKNDSQMTRADEKKWRAYLDSLVVPAARRHHPAMVMELISGLVQHQRYHAGTREAVEEAVAGNFRAVHLAALPGVRGAELLPAVEQILMLAMANANRVRPSEVPDLVRALKTADASVVHMAQLLEYVGFSRKGDSDQIVSHLRRAHLDAEADATAQGRRRMRLHRPNFLDG
jgi:hypothetical protein